MRRFPMKKQLKYADQKGVSFVLIIGPEEVEKKAVIIRNMATKEQFTIDKSQLFDQYVQLLRSQ